jgi:hypothetical protein
MVQQSAQNAPAQPFNLSNNDGAIINTLLTFYNNFTIELLQFTQYQLEFFTNN